MPATPALPRTLLGSRRRILGPAALGVLALTATACGSSASTTSPAATTGTSAVGTAAAGSTPSSAAAAAGDGSRAGSIDVCSLLSPADASAVARQFKLAGDDSATATYKLITEKQPAATTSYPTSSCQFTIAQVTSDNTGSEVILTISVEPAKYMDKTGTKITGLGDEAYDEGEYAQVRVGDVVLLPGQNSGADEDFINGLYRAMIPNLK
jgi:hypothetical protein